MNTLFIGLFFLLLSPILFVFIKNFKHLFLLLMFLVFFIAWIIEDLNLLPHFFSWSIELIIGLSSIYFLLINLIFLKKINTTSIGKYILFLFFYSLLTGIVNFVSFDSLLLGFRAFFKYALLFFVIINSGISKDSYKLFFNSWLMILGIQPFIALFQNLILGYTDDMVYGSILSTGLSSMLLIIFIICIIDLIQRYNKYHTFFYFLIFMSIFIIPILGEAKAFFYVLPVMVLSRYAFELGNLNYKTLLYSSVPFIIGIISFQNFYQVNLYDFGEINTSSFLFSQEKGGIQATNEQSTLAISLSERLLSIFALFDQGYFTNIGKIFFGDGLGSSIFTYESRISFQIATIDDFIRKYTFSNFVKNIGIFGFFIFSYALFKISIFSYQSSQVETDSFFKSLFKIIPIFSLLFIFSMFYTNPFEDVISFSYWFFASGLMFSKKYKNSNNIVL